MNRDIGKRESISIHQEEFRRCVEEYEKHEKYDAIYKIATSFVLRFGSKSSDIADVACGLDVLLLTWNQAFYRYGIFDFDKLENCITKNFRKIENFRNRDISSLSISDEENITDLFNEFLKALQIDTLRFSDENKKKYTKKQLEELLSKWNIDYGGDDLKTIYGSIKDNSKIKDAIEFSETRKKYIEIRISDLEKEIAHMVPEKLIMRSPVGVAKALHLLAPKFFPLWDERIAKAKPYKCYYDKNPAEKYVEFCKKTKIVADEVRNYISCSDKTLLKLIDEYNYSKYKQGWC